MIALFANKTVENPCDLSSIGQRTERRDRGRSVVVSFNRDRMKQDYQQHLHRAFCSPISLDYNKGYNRNSIGQIDSNSLLSKTRCCYFAFLNWSFPSLIKT